MAEITERTRSLCRAATIADRKANAAYIAFCSRRDKMLEWAEFKRLRLLADKAGDAAWDAIEKERKR